MDKGGHSDLNYVSLARTMDTQVKNTQNLTYIVLIILLGSLLNISLTIGAFPLQTGDQKGFYVAQTGSKNGSLILSSPRDIKIFPNDTQALLEWDVLFFNAFGDSWILQLNGDHSDNGTLSNNSFHQFPLYEFFLSPGRHNFTFIATVLDFDNKTITEDDSILVHVIATQDLPPGTTTIDLEGIPHTKVIPTVNQSVEFTVTPSSTPLAGSEQALNDFQTENPAIILTNYFLEINYSQNAVTELWLNISYIDWKIIEILKIDPSTLRIFAFDKGSATWGPAGTTGVDLENQVVYSHINPPNTTYTVGGSSPTLTGGTGPPPTQTTPAITPGFSDGIALALTILGIWITRKRLKKKIISP